MPYRAVGPALQNGPPEYNGKTALEVTEAILAAKRKPTYYHQKRAWVILGYAQARLNKPILPEFQRDMKSLWGLLIRYDKSHRGRQARALILDALRTLGFRSLGWSTSTKMLHFQQHDGTFIANTTGPGKGTMGNDDAHLYHQMEVPMPYEEEVHNARAFETAQWQKYHRYQGFFSIDTDPNSPAKSPKGKLRTQARFFRAIPVPEGPDSVWHALSYWVGGRREVSPNVVEGPNISAPWVLKMRIWAWFMQVLKDSDHDRWRDYHILQSFSERELENYGHLSLLRSFYASPQQGRPAYPVWPSSYNYDALFLIVADYFATQIIVFAVDARKPQIDPADGEPFDSASSSDEIPTNTRPQVDPKDHQAETGYQFRAYGQLLPGGAPQILLATDDWKHFDAVDWDLPARYKPGYFPPNWPRRLDKQLPDPLPDQPRPFNPGPHLQKFPSPWWKTAAAAADDDDDEGNSPPIHLLDATGRPPCKQARYNLIPGELVPLLEDGVTRAHVLTNPIDLREQQDIAGPLSYSALSGFQSNNICLIERDVWTRFESRIDMPGWGFKLPSYEMIESWMEPDQPEVHDQEDDGEEESTDDDKPMMGTTPGTMGMGTGSGSANKSKKKKKKKVAKPVITTVAANAAAGLPPWKQRRREDGQKFDHAAIAEHDERYQIRFGKPPRQNNGAWDMLEEGKNVCLLANPELFFTEASELKM